MEIEVKDVSMRYIMAYDRVSSMKEYLVQKIKGQLKYEEFWALRDINIEVETGEVLGIIGHNGAGKSTLLKVISGILKPSQGTVQVRGRIVPMLELGSGFDYDLTGRENIFLNGAILGYSEEYLKSKYDEIVTFSELGKFIDNPIRNYSSGMLMRLAFSIAAVVDPEILIVDEILAVGDADFQAKSKARMLELMSGGTTVLFVSHSLDQIREMCDRVLWLDHGTIRMLGQTQDVCDIYEGIVLVPKRGFYPAEDTSYRWMSGKSATMLVHHYGTESVLQIPYYFTDTTKVEHTTVSVFLRESDPVQIFDLQQQGILEVHLPERCGNIELRLEISRQWMPNEVYGTDDRRLLGIAVDFQRSMFRQEDSVCLH